MTFHVVILAISSVAAALPSSQSGVHGAEASSIIFPTDDTTWLDIRKSGYAHVDKTAYLERMLDGVRKCFFMTRPRRFGKSVFIQMAREFFLGNEEVFIGLKIHERGNAAFFKKLPGVDISRLEKKKWLECPVISLDFREFRAFKTYKQFEVQYRQMMRGVSKRSGIRGYTLPGFDISTLISELQLKFQLPVAVLIDEYSFPIEHVLYQVQNKTAGTILATDIRNFFDTFFGCIKSAVGKNYIRFVFVTGVSRMGLHALESGANIFQDLTYDRAFATAFGFTEEEIRKNMLQPGVADKFNLGNEMTTKEEKIELLMTTLKDMYDGYNFTIKNGKKGENVFNPISTIACLRTTDPGSHWCSTGSLDTIVAKMYFSNSHIDDFEKCQMKFDEIIETRNPITEYVPLQVQMLVYGYLTVLNYDEKTDVVALTLPNNEITTALKNKFMKYNPTEEDFLKIKPDWLLSLEFQMRIGNVRGTMNYLTRAFHGEYSNTLWQGVNEWDVTRRFKDYLKLARIRAVDSVKFQKCKSSAKQEGGDVDLLTSFLPVNFGFSVKVDKSVFVAIRAFCEYLSEYPDGFKETIGDQGRAKLYLIGVNFKKAGGRTLAHWIYVPYVNGKMNFDKAEASHAYLLENDKFKSIVNDFSG